MMDVTGREMLETDHRCDLLAEVLAEMEGISGEGVVALAELILLQLHLEGCAVFVHLSFYIGVSGGAAEVFGTNQNVAVFVLRAGAPAVAGAIVVVFIEIFAQVEGAAERQLFHHGTDIQTADEVFAVVVVDDTGTVAVEHTYIISEQVEILAFYREEVAGSHDADVTSEAADTADVVVSDKVLDGLAVVEDFQVDRVDGAFQGERGLELAHLDGEFLAGFVLHEGVNHHRGTTEIPLNLIRQGGGELAFQRHTDTTHLQRVVDEPAFLGEIGLIQTLHEAGDFQGFLRFETHWEQDAY